MTLQHLVRERYTAPEELFLVYDQKANTEGFADTAQLRLVMGHFKYGYHQFSERPARYFTFLRNPLDQVISHYHYTFDHPEKFETLPENMESIVDFAESERGYNLQTRYISGIKNLKGREEEALELAKYNLENNFEGIGITEEFDTSLVMLADHLQWQRFFYKKANEGQARKKITRPDEETTKRILELNRYDIELYSFGYKLYEKQKQTHPDLKAKVRQFQFRNKWFWKLNPAYTRLKVLLQMENKSLFNKSKPD